MISQEDFIGWLKYMGIKHLIDFLDYKELYYSIRKNGWTEENQKEAVSFMNEYGITDPDLYFDTVYHKQSIKELEFDYYKDKKADILQAVKILNAFVNVMPAGQT